MSNHPEKIIKIVVIGPESTGKSTLCEALASHFKTIWCKEYAREYLMDQGTDYSFEDLLTIAKGQLKGEEEAMAAVEKLHRPNPMLIIDTDMYVMKVWCEFVFGKCHQFILDEIVSRQYDGYLLCKPDLPWTKDELREYPDLEIREKLYHHYRDLLIHQTTPWFEVKGTGQARIESAIDWIESIFGATNKK